MAQGMSMYDKKPKLTTVSKNGGSDRGEKS